MSLFNKVFGTPEARQVKRLFKEARAHVDATYGPLGALGRAIAETTWVVWQNLGTVFGFDKKQSPSEREILLLYELIYFFCHLTWRTAVANRFSNAHIAKLQTYLCPLLASTAVDTFCLHWPEEVKSKIRNEFLEKLNEAEIDYSECRGLVSESDPLSRSTLIGRFGGHAAALWEREGDPVAELAVGTEMIRAFSDMKLKSLVTDVAAVIDAVD